MYFIRFTFYFETLHSFTHKYIFNVFDIKCVFMQNKLCSHMYRNHSSVITIGQSAMRNIGNAGVNPVVSLLWLIFN